MTGADQAAFMLLAGAVTAMAYAAYCCRKVSRLRVQLGVEPYTPEQRRVCDYLQEIMPEVGCGLDPVGFLIASHAALRLRDAVD